MRDLSHLMPDTQGINFYTADPDLAFLLKRCLTEEDFEQAQEIFYDLGAVASQRMDGLAESEPPPI